MAFAIVYEETAVGAPNIIIKVASSIPLKPINIEIPTKIKGTTTNLPIIPIIFCFKFFLIFLNTKEEPRTINDNGVVILATSLIAL